MGTEILERQFAAIGGRIKLTGSGRGAPQIDVRSDGRGEFFEVRFAGRVHLVDLEVVDVERAERHLLLLARDGGEKSKFLCGHDEWHWFVAAVPESVRGVRGVETGRPLCSPSSSATRSSGFARSTRSGVGTQRMSARASGSSFPLRACTHP